jgi:hypothetical protein
MKKQTRHKPAVGKFSLLRQLCNFIPPHLVPFLARQTGVRDHACTFSPWSHVVSLLYAQLTHSSGFNDVCDALRLHSVSLSASRGSIPPHKNTLSHANRRARELCASVQAGEIVIFDKTYVDFAHLADLSSREVFWVTRAKDNLPCHIVRRLQTPQQAYLVGFG